MGVALASRGIRFRFRFWSDFAECTREQLKVRLPSNEVRTAFTYKRALGRMQGRRLCSTLQSISAERNPKFVSEAMQVKFLTKPESPRDS